MAKPGPKFANSYLFLMLDLLDADGGWLTGYMFEEMIPDLQPSSVRRNLTRLRDRGWAESRERPTTQNGLGEHEWKITQAGREQIDVAMSELVA